MSIQTVKFKRPGETVYTLSDQDRTISSLKSIIADLNLQLEELSSRIMTLSQKAQKFLQSQNRTSALAALRSKKLNEISLKQRSESLAQLEEVYSQIAQAADQVTIVRTMEASAAILKSLHADTGGVDRVEDVLADLRDEMAKVDEVSTAIEAGGQGDHIIDESAVDEELENMEQQATLEREKAQALETQKRLARIGDPNGPTKSRENQKPSSAEFPVGSLEESVQAMKRLSLDKKVLSGVQDSDVTLVSAERTPNIT